MAFFNEKRAKQLLDFEDLVYCQNARPTDIDLFMEIQDRFYVIGEFKLKGNPVPRGQVLAIERTAKRLNRDSAKCIAFIAEHQVEDSRYVIIAKDCIVVHFWMDGVWYDVDPARTVQSIMDEFVGTGTIGDCT